MSCRICGCSRLRPAGAVAGYDFVECALCAFTFAPAITAEAMAALYRQGYHGIGNGAPEIGWANADFLEPALSHLRGRLRILDFGCGESLVPEMLRGEGHRVVTVDIVPPRHPHPDRLTGTLHTHGLERGAFDLVYAFQVFEHLPEPRPIFEALLGMVRPGGLCLIHTDMEMPEREAGLEAWWYATPPDHCAFYRHRTFEMLTAGTPHRIAWRDRKSVLIRVGEARPAQSAGSFRSDDIRQERRVQPRKGGPGGPPDTDQRSAKRFRWKSVSPNDRSIMVSRLK